MVCDHLQQIPTLHTAVRYLKANCASSTLSTQLACEEDTLSSSANRFDNGQMSDNIAPTRCSASRLARRRRKPRRFPISMHSNYCCPPMSVIASRPARSQQPSFSRISMARIRVGYPERAGELRATFVAFQRSARPQSTMPQTLAAGTMVVWQLLTFRRLFCNYIERENTVPATFSFVQPVLHHFRP